MDITRLKNNSEYFDDSYFAETDVELWLKESPDFHLHIDEMYFEDIFGLNPIFDGKPWRGFTRDCNEFVGGWEDSTEMQDIDEYLTDMLRYKGREFKWEETPEVFELIVDFLTYAKQTGQTVVVEVS